VPPKYAAEVGKRFAEAPIGSGPYMLEYWHRNAEVALVASPT
jgi:ABC-type oligopeptide transport system substrate-binding subunit